eukprot:gnl/Spiro4/4684_TR2336_c0_g1_i1.p1 gnl/Spiro4/4684_TR2336_c0_g1~~gnl/Spiro4/4684_TR2336_c0_g1_i1.p1  ORF type:complete len:349 (-),score=101.19 gnl/Spiro4/4684_TR2336_c0_g1_i1:101-1147(-)
MSSNCADDGVPVAPCPSPSPTPSPCCSLQQLLGIPPYVSWRPNMSAAGVAWFWLVVLCAVMALVWAYLLTAVVAFWVLVPAVVLLWRRSRRSLTYQEIMDLPWFPAFLVNYLQDGLLYQWYLTYALGRIRPHQLQAIQDVCAASPQRTLVSLCAGGGGVEPFLQDYLAQSGTSMRLYLTDLVPNPSRWRQLQSRTSQVVEFSAEPVNALHCHIAGVRTICGALHHFPPDLVRDMLQNAVDSSSPIIIIDGTADMVMPLTLPFMGVASLAVSALNEWYDLRKLFFTFVVPVLPFVIMHDGFVSSLRFYGVEDFREIISRVEGHESFEWQFMHGDAAAPAITIGRPKKSA